MQNAAGDDVATPPDDRNVAYRSIVSNLASLIEHVQADLQLIEAAIDREAWLDDQEVSDNVIVLDDVTPRYVKARAALRTCDQDLGAAIRFLRDSRTSRRGPARSPALSTIHA